MSVNIYPEAGDLISAADVSAAWGALQDNQVVSGLVITDAGGAQVQMSAGATMIGGKWVEEDGTILSSPFVDGVHLIYIDDTGALTGSDTLTLPANAVPLALIYVTGGAVAQLFDIRPMRFSRSDVWANVTADGYYRFGQIGDPETASGGVDAWGRFKIRDLKGTTLIDGFFQSMSGEDFALRLQIGRGSSPLVNALRVVEATTGQGTAIELSVTGATADTFLICEWHDARNIDPVAFEAGNVPGTHTDNTFSLTAPADLSFLVGTSGGVFQVGKDGAAYSNGSAASVTFAEEADVTLNPPTDNTKVMTPLRTYQMILTQASSGSFDPVQHEMFSPRLGARL